jgi:hypothetical protein
MRRTPPTVFLGNVATLVLAFCTLPASAQTGGDIDVTGLSDGLFVLNAEGNIVAQAVSTEADEDANGPAFIYRIPDATFVDPRQFGVSTILLENPNDITSGSDIFGISVGPGSRLLLSFASDLEGIPIPFGVGLNNPVFAEVPPGFYDATQYLNPDLQANGFHAVFYSDGEVPEPSSLVLLVCSALASVGVLGKKLRGHTWDVLLSSAAEARTRKRLRRPILSACCATVAD